MQTNARTIDQDEGCRLCLTGGQVKATKYVVFPTLRKVTTNHRIFPSDEAVYKLISLAMRNIAKKWTMPIRDWKPALNRFAVEFAERFPK